MKLEIAYVGKIITTFVHEFEYIVLNDLGICMRESSCYPSERPLTDSSEMSKVSLRRSLRASSSSSSRSCIT